jgi:hypothetical protein
MDARKKDAEMTFRQLFKQFGVAEEKVLAAAKRLRDQWESELLQVLCESTSNRSGSQNVNLGNSCSRIEGNLWKTAHYKIIEEYRNQIKSVRLFSN